MVRLFGNPVRHRLRQGECDLEAGVDSCHQRGRQAPDRANDVMLADRIEVLVI